MSVEIKRITDYNQFLKGKLTSAVVKFIEHLDQIKDGNRTSVFFLDFTKAFDCLVHGLLRRAK